MVRRRLSRAGSGKVQRKTRGPSEAGRCPRTEARFEGTEMCAASQPDLAGSYRRGKGQGRLAGYGTPGLARLSRRGWTAPARGPRRRIVGGPGAQHGASCSIATGGGIRMTVFGGIGKIS